MAERATRGEGRGNPRTPGPATGAADEGALHRRDLIRWGPVVAGLLVTITTLLILTVLGVALGLSVFEPTDGGLDTADTAATIWGIASFLIAFFLGGFTAARTAGVGGGDRGAFNGVMVGVTSISLIVLLVGLGVGNTLGAAASNIGEIADAVRNVDVDPDQAGDVAETAFEDAEGGAWGTFIGLMVALAAAAAGGLVGHRPSADDPRADAR